MSATTPSQALASASESAPTDSTPANNDDRFSVDQQLANPVSALAIEAHLGRFGCAVLVQEEQQLLLCEDLPCTFAFDDQDKQPASHRRPGEQLERRDQQDQDATPSVGDAGVMLGSASYGVVESCELTFRSHFSQAHTRQFISTSRIPAHHF